MRKRDACLSASLLGVPLASAVSLVQEFLSLLTSSGSSGEGCTCLLMGALCLRPTWGSLNNVNDGENGVSAGMEVL